MLMFVYDNNKINNNTSKNHQPITIKPITINIITKVPLRPKRISENIPQKINNVVIVIFSLMNQLYIK